jgi:hypothetical protein
MVNVLDMSIDGYSKTFLAQNPSSIAVFGTLTTGTRTTALFSFDDAFMVILAITAALSKPGVPRSAGVVRYKDALGREMETDATYLIDASSFLMVFVALPLVLGERAGS